MLFYPLCPVLYILNFVIYHIELKMVYLKYRDDLISVKIKIAGAVCSDLCIQAYNHIDLYIKCKVVIE